MQKPERSEARAELRGYRRGVRDAAELSRAHDARGDTAAGILKLLNREPLSAASVAGMPSDDALVALHDAANAYADFALARERMNAAIPDIMTATPAERALYDERYKEDHEAQREHHSTAIRLAYHAQSILALFASPSDGDGNGGKPNPGGANG
jgi:hypothetical protein